MCSGWHNAGRGCNVSKNNTFSPLAHGAVLYSVGVSFCEREGQGVRVWINSISWRRPNYGRAVLACLREMHPDVSVCCTTSPWPASLSRNYFRTSSDGVSSRITSTHPSIRQATTPFAHSRIILSIETLPKDRTSRAVSPQSFLSFTRHHRGADSRFGRAV